MLLGRVKGDRKTRIDVDFPGLPKWFGPDVTLELSRIRRAIMAEPMPWARRVFWVAMASTVRHVCNSRGSTFKLHIRSCDELAGRRPSPVAVFGGFLTRDLGLIAEHARGLAQAGHLRAGRYRGQVRVELADVLRLEERHYLQGCCDLLMTSPPYGDNTSTVPYGQYSYLPLQWVDLADISPDASPALLVTTHKVDAMSLGGSRQACLGRAAPLAAKCGSFAEVVERLSGQPPDRLKRVAAFCADLDAALDPILWMVRDGGLMLWTVGNRRVGGVPLPLDAILCELMATRGVSVVTSVQRQISGKRMAYRNSIAPTIRDETVLLFRKGGGR